MSLNCIRLIFLTALVLATVAVGGCVVREAVMRASRTAAVLEVAPSLGTEAVFVCAERQLQTLAKDNSLWVPELTRRDTITAIL